mmetsp:Transcript_12509/g.18679  ORF Transcript_12509/g.18679 Transcript_12509/m.18679 type:complete len:613 (+) Transcript_12509:22-1860(+)
MSCPTGCIPTDECSSSSGSSSESSSEIPAYTIIILVVLLLLSGLFSGLNLGLMSLDKIGLDIVQKSGTEAEKKYANGLIPLREKGNLLLCTLLLGNTAVNAVLAVLMADLTGGLIGSAATTFGIVIFGEIIPQSVCSRNGLAIGYYTRYIVYFFMITMFVVAAPISWILDYVLEEEIGSIYNREQLKRLFEIHAGPYGDLNNEEAKMLKGVLHMYKKTVRQIMTPIEKVYMLDINSRMDFKTMANILAKGHSRVPVYDGDENNIYKLLLVKNMIMLNPGDEVPLRTLMQEGFPDVLYVKPDITLADMLHEFQNGGSHLAVVTEVQEEFKSSKGTDKKGIEMKTMGLQKVTKRKNIGIVTLEDVIETMIQDDIADETDEHKGKGDEADDEDGTNIGKKFLRVLRRKNKFKSSSLSITEGRVITSFLQGMFDPFRPDVISTRAVEKLVQASEMVQLKPEDEDIKVYSLGEEANFCALILDGSLQITVGVHKFQSEAGIWKIMGLHALTEEKYTADFTATVNKECTLLKIRREDYKLVCAGKTIGTRKGRADSDPRLKKLPSLPTVSALRKQYGKEVEYAEELKKGPTREARLSTNESQRSQRAPMLPDKKDEKR